jgi:hypothetical protein
MNELDPPEMNAGPRGTFSVGPIELTDDETLSVLALVKKINKAFHEAFIEGTSPHQYFIEARLRPIAASSAAIMSQANVNKINTATTNRELAVEYKIYNDDNVGFALQFRSGPHGAISGLQLSPEGIPAASITVNNNPDVVAIATSYCSLDATITDKPPISPDVVFVPYVGVNNKVMVLFNSNAGEKKEYPILLRNTDIVFILEEYLAQHQIELRVDEVLQLKESGEQKKLQYRNDDPIRKYELFISNPTYIFEIEMVDNKGQMFMRQKIIAFKPQKLDYKKTGRRFLAIQPRFEQRTYDQAAEQPGLVSLNEAPTSNILGSADVRQVSSVWGKKFKVRVTSKKTGRKIDLNIAFKNTGVIIP